jgi:hypothetical protein
MGLLRKNRFWIWNKWDRSLLLFKPLSLFVVGLAGFFALIAVISIILQIFGVAV